MLLGWETCRCKCVVCIKKIRSYHSKRFLFPCRIYRSTGVHEYKPLLFYYRPNLLMAVWNALGRVFNSKSSQKKTYFAKNQPVERKYAFVHKYLISLSSHHGESTRRGCNSRSREKNKVEWQRWMEWSVIRMTPKAIER